ncbi:MAG: MFS transporter [Chloroflexi bacterium]|nr:MFS transporter [Chloroflexota bacterium]
MAVSDTTDRRGQDDAPEGVGPGHDAPGPTPAQDGWVETGLTPRQIKLTLAGVTLAMFLSAMDQTIVGTALPRIISDLGGFDRFTWVTTSYIVASTAVIPLAGAVADVYGRKWLYVAGLVVFLVGSVLAGSAGTMNMLIAFRAIQGVGAGVMMALAFVTIADMFPPAERAKYTGLIAGVFGISSVIGPTLGGFLTDSLSWHWIFFVNLPLGIPVIFLFVKLFPDRKPARGRKIDIPGATLLVMTIVPGLVGVSWGGVQYAWDSVQVIGALTISVVAGLAFVFTELRVSDPIMPFGIFKNRIVAISLVIIFLTGFAMFGAMVFIPLLFQGVLGASPTESGSFMTPMMLGVVAGAALSGQVLSRTGGHYRTQGIVGLGIMLFGMGVLTQVSDHANYSFALTGAITMGFGLGTTFPLFTIAVQNAVPFRSLGVATSSTQFFRSVGGSLGLAIMGSYMVKRFRDGLGSALPEGTDSVLSVERISNISDNPSALLDPNSLSVLRDEITASSDPAFADRVINGMEAALASALSDVFTVAFFMGVAALVVVLFLKEIPLRRREHPAPDAAREAPRPVTRPETAGGGE